MYDIMQAMAASGVIMLVALALTVKGQGKTPPLLPQEFASNMIQNKYNSNGFHVNHTYAAITTPFQLVGS
jgi:hypothetical protein